jgi:hypothetical protein
MKIVNDIPELESFYFEESFIQTIEAHLTYLRQTNISFKTIDNHLLDKYKGDFYGLLDELRIGKEYHYAIMRINGLTNSDNYRSNMTVIVMPSLIEIDLIKDVYRTKK